MPYVFRPKDHGVSSLTADSATGFGGTPLGGGSSVGTASASRSRGMISTVSAAFKGFDSPFRGGSRAPERGFPERIEAPGDGPGIMPYVATAAMAPGHTLERPIAIADKATGGAVGDIISGIGGFGIGEDGPEIGDLVNAAGWALETAGNFTSALVNSGEAGHLREIIEGDYAPNDLVPEEWKKMSGGGLFGIGGHTMTVREFLEDLEKRNFNLDPATGQRLAWEDVVANMDGDPIGTFKFGHAGVSDNQLVDLAWKIGTDPSNLAFGLGLFGKGAKIARWAVNPALKVAAPAGMALRSTWGVGFAADMVQSGLRVANLPSAAISARMIQAGRFEQATLKGLGLALSTPRRLLLPGTGSVATRYARGALRTELTLLGTEYGAGSIRNVATAVTDDPENPVSGFFDEIHDLSQGLLAEKPLSENMVWNITAAFALPAVPLLKEDLGSLRRGARKRLGDPDTTIWAETYAANPIEGTDLTLGIRRGFKQERQFVEDLGRMDRAEINPRTGEFSMPKPDAGDLERGRKVFAGMIDHIRMRIAFKKMTDFKAIRDHYESLEEALYRNQALADDVRAYAADLAERGKFKARDLMDEFEDWAHGRFKTVVDREGNLVKNVREAVDFDLTPTQRLEQYILWKRAMSDLQSKFGPLADGILGRAKRMTVEMIDDLSATLRAMADDAGRVSTEKVRGILSKYPAMFDDVSVLSRGDEEFWRTLMNAGRAGIGDGMGNAVKGADATYALDQLLPRLESLRKVSPKARELFHEAGRAERAAAKSTPTAGGPVASGGFRRIYSMKQLREFRSRSNGRLRSLTREISEQAAAFERRWTKRGNRRAGRLDPNEPLPAPRDVPDPSTRPVNPDLQDVANAYNAARRLPPIRRGEYFKVDDDFSKRTADAYEALPAVDEAARPAYNAFAKETLAQWKALEKAGYKMEPWDPKKHGGKEQPYANSGEMAADVAKKHLYFFTGGDPHPFLNDVAIPAAGYTYNDIFRAVHDIMTHAQEGFQFGARGELNAAIKHSQMYSPLARKAMLSETHGQNSWVNFHEKSVANRTKPGSVYADQKAALLPDEILAEFGDRFVLDSSKWGDIRAKAQADLTAMRDEATALRKELREANARADEIRTTRIDPTFLDEAGNPKVTGESLEALQEQTLYVRENYPAYDLEAGPKVALRYSPEDGHMAALLTERSNIARVLFDYGPLGRVTRFFDALAMRPVKNSKMAHDARQMVFNRLLPMGASAKKVDLFLAKLTEAQADWTIGKVQAPLFRGTTAMPANKINAIAREVFEGDDKFLDAFRARYGGADRFHAMLDESANSLARRVDLKKLRGQKVGVFEGITRAGYWAWQRHFRGLSDGTRLVSKMFYPWIRFQADIRWQALNMVEADVIAFFRDGMKGTRMGRTPERILRRGGKDVNISRNALAYHTSRSGIPVPPKMADAIGQSPINARQFADDMGGAYIVSANFGPVARKSFDAARPQTVQKVINEFADQDNVIRILRRTFGEEKGTWAKQLDEMLYSFDRLGVRKSMDEAVRKVRKYERWTQAEMDELVPFVNKLVERNQQAFDDMLQVHLGNTSRSRLERIANSYWLYWPLSYQIKATKWLVGVLTERGFGQQTNLGGAFLLERAAEVYRTQIRENPEFAKQAEENELIHFMASMVLPIAPWDWGQSLNRIVRYAGGNVLDLWPAYAINDVGDVVTKALEMGPIYTAELFDRFVGHVSGGETRQIEIPVNTDRPRNFTAP